MGIFMNASEMVSDFDGLKLSVEKCVPEGTVKGVVVLSHGMAEHKERYETFLQYLAENGYVAVIHDHRGHGKSIKSAEDLGYFYTTDISGIVADLHQMVVQMKAEYPGVPVYLFSHSMGTLVARNYLKKYDGEIEKLVLCGPPTANPAAGMGIFLNRLITRFKGEKHRSAFQNGLATGAFNKKFGAEGPNAWLCTDPEMVKKYNENPLCGYCFTNNGFYNLFRLQKEAFTKDGWQMKNAELPILLIAGADDPVIADEKKFYQLEDFLKERGYKNVQAKLYEGKRHELLNEIGKEQIFADVLKFLNESVV